MHSADGRAVISFNGEIYNYRELRPELEARGRRLRTRTDTEVLIEAVREWGGLAFPRIDGMYAFALYDPTAARSGSRAIRSARSRSTTCTTASGSRSRPSCTRCSSSRSSTPRSARRGSPSTLLHYVGAPRTLYRAAAKLPPG